LTDPRSLDYREYLRAVYDTMQGFLRGAEPSRETWASVREILKYIVLARSAEAVTKVGSVQNAEFLCSRCPAMGAVFVEDFLSAEPKVLAYNTVREIPTVYCQDLARMALTIACCFERPGRVFKVKQRLRGEVSDFQVSYSVNPDSFLLMSAWKDMI
jgi:hypothetical protein